MPPRPKRTRLHPARATTRSQAQVAQAPNKPAPTTKAGPSTEPVRPQRTRSNLIMEVVLPTSRKPTPKTSSAPTPESFTAAEPEPSPVQEEEIAEEIFPLDSPSLVPSPPAKESTPRAVPAKDKGKQKMGSLPPSSPPPNSSPELGPAWDRSSHGSTPTPSPSRSRQASRQTLPGLPVVATVLVPGTPSSSQPAPTEPTQLQQLPTPTSSPPPFGFASAPKPSTGVELEEAELELEAEPEPEPEPEPEYKPPTSPIPYSDTAAPDDPFGFFAAEDRLKERRAVLERDNPVMSFGMPSSGGPGDFDQSTYEEAFASIFYDPRSGTITGTQASTTGSDKENAGVDTNRGNRKGKGKKTMEVVIPTKTRGKEKEPEKESEKEKGAAQDSPRVMRGKGKAKEKEKEHVLTTYELEAMLPRRPKRTRKPRIEEAERISLSDEDDEDDEEDEEEDSPKRRKKTTSSRGKATSRGGATARGTRGKGKKDKESMASTSKAAAKTTSRPSKRVRSFETSHMDEETRERFEAERNRRLEAYKALDGYTLEEEEVVW